MPPAPLPRHRLLALLALLAAAASILAPAQSGVAQVPPQARLWLPALLSRAPMPTPGEAASPVATARATATRLPTGTAAPSATPGDDTPPRPTASAPPWPSASPTVGTAACAVFQATSVILAVFD